MHRILHRLIDLPLVAMLGLLACSHAAVTAQDVRELSEPVGQVTLLGRTPSSINAYLGLGYRIVDLEYRGTNGFGTPSFDVELVSNSGPYSSGWWWYYNQTAAQLDASLTANNGRLIDVETWVDTAGTRRFACIMVPNTGSQAKAWWWYHGASPSYLSGRVSANNARIVDLESYVVGGTTYYAAIMIRNTGSDYRNWWWYHNVPASSVNIQINVNNAQLYDIERHINGNFHAVMVRRTSQPDWHWWHGVTASEIDYLTDNYGVRPIDLESYNTGAGLRFAMIAINNSNALETLVGNQMRAATDGQVGAWLHGVNGPTYATLNGSTTFEPASTMKTLHHVHAMRRVRLGAVSLTQPITVHNAYAPVGSSCPTTANPIPEALSTVLRLMMQQSDNARTQAITAYFGQANINNTASALGMTNTSLNHTLGCGGPIRNEISLRDLHELHEQVANGYLGPYRSSFYSLMREGMADLNLDAIVTAEAAALNLSSHTRQSFLDLCRLAHKGGSYGVWTGSAYTYHRAEFGWVSLPFLDGVGALAEREFTFGAFVNDSTSPTTADTAVWSRAIPELMRGQIRAAIQTWVGQTATVTLQGTGCGSPTPYTQSVIGLPRLGGSVLYRGHNGFPSSLALCGIGYSDTSWNGQSLPASLQPFGGEPGCMAFNEVGFSAAYVANGAGTASHAFSIPLVASLNGLPFFTQWYTVGPSSFRSSNSVRSQVGY